jgi:hypothetical protein
MSETGDLHALLDQYEIALGYTDALRADLTPEQLMWRPTENSSSIAWHLAHQPAVAYFMLRNLTAAAPRLDPELELVADSATPEVERGRLPSRDEIGAFRTEVADRVRGGIARIAGGDVPAPAQLTIVATTLMTSIINHEYQHDVWINEVRSTQLGLSAIGPPASPTLAVVDGYPVLTAN